MAGSQTIRCLGTSAVFYPLLRKPGGAYVDRIYDQMLGFHLTSSDEQDRGDLKPIPETKDAVAVALHQAQETDRAPKVVAAGRGTTAEQILQIAFAQGIKVREDADLAQLLSAVNDDTEIPLTPLRPSPKFLSIFTAPMAKPLRSPSGRNVRRREKRDRARTGRGPG